MDKEALKKMYMEAAFQASAAKAFSVTKDSYLYKQLESSFEVFYKNYQEANKENK